jgi:DNA invertase Pin-like site-specific DNA recombinase
MDRYDVCIFAAVSTEKQATDDKTSLETQLEKCREWCYRGGHRIVAEIVVPGHSRTYYSLDELVHDCQEYAQMLDLARTRKINLVLCPIFDRLWRTPVLEAQVTHFLKVYGVQTQSLQMPVPLLPPDQVSLDVDPGDLLRMISGYLARVDTQTRLWRIVEEHRKRVMEKGLSWGGRRLFGWQRISPLLPLVPDEEEMSWYLQMVEWIEEGVSIHEVANRLYAAGIRGTTGAVMKNRSVLHILRNPFYAGGMRLKEYERNPITKQRKQTGEKVRWGVAQHTPVISRERWERLQKILEGRWTPRPQTYTRVWGLQGLCRCAYCGYAMIHAFHRRDYGPRGGHWFLRCAYNGARVRHQSKCPNKDYSEARIERMVVAETKRILYNPRQYILAQQAATQAQDQVSVEMLTLQLDAVNKRIGRVTTAITMNDALESLVKTLSDLEQVKTRLVEQIAEAEARGRDWEGFERQAIKLRTVLDQLDQADPELLHKVFSSLYKTIYISREGLRFEMLA